MLERDRFRQQVEADFLASLFVDDEPFHLRVFHCARTGHRELPEEPVQLWSVSQHLLEQFAQPIGVLSVLSAVFVIAHGLLRLALLFSERNVVLRFVEVGAAQAGQIVCEVFVQYVVSEHDVKAEAEADAEHAAHPLVIKFAVLGVGFLLVAFGYVDEQLH